MDKDGNGCIEPSEVMDCYDTSKHPDVMSGKKTPQEVRPTKRSPNSVKCCGKY